MSAYLDKTGDALIGLMRLLIIELVCCPINSYPALLQPASFNEFSSVAAGFRPPIYPPGLAPLAAYTSPYGLAMGAAAAADPMAAAAW